MKNLTSTSPWTIVTTRPPHTTRPSHTTCPTIDKSALSQELEGGEPDLNLSTIIDEHASITHYASGHQHSLVSIDNSLDDTITAKFKELIQWEEWLRASATGEQLEDNPKDNPEDNTPRGTITRTTTQRRGPR